MIETTRNSFYMPCHTHSLNEANCGWYNFSHSLLLLSFLLFSCLQSAIFAYKTMSQNTCNCPKESSDALPQNPADTPVKICYTY